MPVDMRLINYKYKTVRNKRCGAVGTHFQLVRHLGAGNFGATYQIRFGDGGGNNFVPHEARYDAKLKQTIMISANLEPGNYYSCQVMLPKRKKSLGEEAAYSWFFNSNFNIAPSQVIDSENIRTYKSTYHIVSAQMPLLHGMSLHDYLATINLKKLSPLSTEQKFKLIIDLLEHFDSRHQVGAIHRDVKSNNIFVRKISNNSQGGDYSFNNLRVEAIDDGGTTERTIHRKSLINFVSQTPEASVHRSFQKTDVFALSEIIAEIITANERNICYKSRDAVQKKLENPGNAIDQHLKIKQYLIPYDFSVIDAGLRDLPEEKLKYLKLFLKEMSHPCAVRRPNVKQCIKFIEDLAGLSEVKSGIDAFKNYVLNRLAEEKNFIDENGQDYDSDEIKINKESIVTLYGNLIEKINKEVKDENSNFELTTVLDEIDYLNVNAALHNYLYDIEKQLKTLTNVTTVENGKLHDCFIAQRRTRLCADIQAAKTSDIECIKSVQAQESYKALIKEYYPNAHVEQIFKQIATVPLDDIKMMKMRADDLVATDLNYPQYNKLLEIRHDISRLDSKLLNILTGDVGSSRLPDVYMDDVSSLVTESKKHHVKCEELIQGYTLRFSMRGPEFIRNFEQSVDSLNGHINEHTNKCDKYIKLNANKIAFDKAVGSHRYNPDKLLLDTLVNAEDMLDTVIKHNQKQVLSSSLKLEKDLNLSELSNAMFNTKKLLTDIKYGYYGDKSLIAQSATGSHTGRSIDPNFKAYCFKLILDINYYQVATDLMQCKLRKRSSTMFNNTRAQEKEKIIKLTQAKNQLSSVRDNFKPEQVVTADADNNMLIVKNSIESVTTALTTAKDACAKHFSRWSKIYETLRNIFRFDKTAPKKHSKTRTEQHIESTQSYLEQSSSAFGITPAA